MTAALNLLLNKFESVENRVLPRFPLNYLTFRIDSEMNTPRSTFSVRDLSLTGMQIEKKAGEIGHREGDEVSGHVSWYGDKCHLSARVVWVKDSRLGLEFTNAKEASQSITDFLSHKKIIKHLKPLHKAEYKIKMPVGLKYWLQTDGPVEFFMWVFQSGEISKLQFIHYKQFLEWDFFKGLKTGEVISVRGKETPLSSEDEFQFKFDQIIDKTFIAKVEKLFNELGHESFQLEDYNFILKKLQI